MKYSFILSYYKRPIQFHNSLVSFRHFYKYRDDYEVIVVADIKNTEKDISEVREVISNFPNIKFSFSIFDAPGAKTDLTHARLLNEGVRRCNGEYIIISMPEIFHTANILGAFDRFLSKNPNPYIVCSCLADPAVHKKIEKFEDFKYTKGQWYQHPVNRNKGIYFLGCVKKDFYWTIGGSNELYADGLGHEDTSFRLRVFRSGIEVITPGEELLTVHQWHDHHFTLFGKEVALEKEKKNTIFSKKEYRYLNSKKVEDGIKAEGISFLSKKVYTYDNIPKGEPF